MIVYNSIVFFLLFVNPSIQEQGPCKKVEISFKVEDIVAQRSNGKITINVEKTAFPVKYFFFDKDGALLNEDFSKNELDGLAKGAYTCLVRQRGGCKSKIEFEIK
jgi:hypothetical protein